MKTLTFKALVTVYHEKIKLTFTVWYKSMAAVVKYLDINNDDFSNCPFDFEAVDKYGTHWEQDLDVYRAVCQFFR